MKAAIDNHLGVSQSKTFGNGVQISAIVLLKVCTCLVKDGRIQRKGGGRSTYYVKS